MDEKDLTGIIVQLASKSLDSNNLKPFTEWLLTAKNQELIKESAIISKNELLTHSFMIQWLYEQQIQLKDKNTVLKEEVIHSEYAEAAGMSSLTFGLLGGSFQSGFIKEKISKAAATDKNKKLNMRAKAQPASTVARKAKKDRKIDALKDLIKLAEAQSERRASNPVIFKRINKMETWIEAWVEASEGGGASVGCCARTEAGAKKRASAMTKRPIGKRMKHPFRLGVREFGLFERCCTTEIPTGILNSVMLRWRKVRDSNTPN